MNRIITLFFLFSINYQLFSQHLIGLNKEQVISVMKKDYPSFDLDNSTVNYTYKYLKYIDKFSEQTMLIFLSDNNVCTSTKLISDYSNINEVKNKLNTTCKKSGKDKWTYMVQGKTFLVTLQRTEWFFTVFTTSKK